MLPPKRARPAPPGVGNLPRVRLGQEVDVAAVLALHAVGLGAAAGVAADEGEEDHLCSRGRSYHATRPTRILTTPGMRRVTALSQRSAVGRLIRNARATVRLEWRPPSRRSETRSRTSKAVGLVVGLRRLRVKSLPPPSTTRSATPVRPRKKCRSLRRLRAAGRCRQNTPKFESAAFRRPARPCKTLPAETDWDPIYRSMPCLPRRNASKRD